MQVLAMKIKRLARRCFVGAERFLRAHAVLLILFALLAAAGYGVSSMEKGSFAYCTDSLVRCLEDEAMTQKGLKKSVAIMKCSVRTLWCDLETLFFAATTRKRSADLLETPLAEEAEGVETLENPRTFENAASESEAFAAPAASFEETVRALEESGAGGFPVLEEKEMTGPELLEEMKRLRKEREFFEKNQNEFHKKVFEALEKAHKTGIVSEKEKAAAE